MSIDDGGPAFPKQCFECEDMEVGPDGLSKRDWFAGMALQGMLSIPPSQLASEFSIQEIVEGTYRWADVMLKERSK